MGFSSDLRAWSIGVSAPWSVSHHRGLDLAEGRLPAITRERVPTRHGTVKVRVQRPREAAGAAVVLHLHGGALVMRHPRMDDFWARFVADRVGAAVVNVDYLVAPRVRYPVAHEQVYDVLAWLGAHAGSWGLDADRIAISGFSAGGNLAASACLQARDAGTAMPRLQLLGVPSLDVSDDVRAKSSPLRSPMVSPELLTLVRDTYYRDAARRGEPFASPLLTPDVRGLAPAVVVTAEYDALRGEGDAYARRLAGAGLLVAHHVEAARDHYFLQGGTTAARTRMDWMAAHLREALSP
ncbi:MAG TPA: alpha/beta hydrolase [Nocardioides sp.]|nr:alpha/beta hydrolase [Nocardioides sp.]